jgi:exopolysaccharide biosynthesis polyprenyl glycosylphosphotransferase
MSRSPNALRDTFVPLALLIGDTFMTFAGLTLGWWMRYESPIGRLGLDVPNATFARYLPLLLVGVALLLAAFAQFGLYDGRLVLRRYQSLNAILKGAAFWFVAYLGISLVLKFDPPISRLFALLAFAWVVGLLYLWRSLAYAIVMQGPLLAHLRRRVVLLGWNEDARALAADIAKDPFHPLALVAIVTLPQPAETTTPFETTRATHITKLQEIGEIEEVLTRERADLLIATRLDLSRQAIRKIVEMCERSYVEWKIVPGSFDIFLSGLRLQTIGRVPVLGVEALAIERLLYRALKRCVDVGGSLVGLILSAPIILVLAALIKRESSNGPVFFRQQRIGSNHRPFTLYKLRSMLPNAAASDSAQQSTTRSDPRLLRLGGSMRRWNLDELPQFWNVLCGDMSLVGPRPERPFHVDQLAREIPHYLPRHLVKPGMTGWAQVNGLRGDSDLVARVQHDIYYIENWSVWLDVQILLLTFVRWRNPSAY